MKTYSLNLDDEALRVLTALKESTKAPDMAAVLRNALGVYNSLYAILAENPGKRIALIDREAGEMQELTIPCLQEAAE